MRQPASRLLPALLAVGCLALAGCAADSSPRNSVGQVTASAPADAFSLRPGDCTGQIPAGSADRITLLPCSSEHPWEVIAASQLEGDEFPGAGKVRDEAEAFCADAFEAFVGLPVTKSDYDLRVLQPTKQTWTSADDRAVTCLAGRDGGTFTATLENTKK